jgi:hypothetical protein
MAGIIGARGVNTQTREVLLSYFVAATPID